WHSAGTFDTSITDFALFFHGHNLPIPLHTFPDSPENILWTCYSLISIFSPILIEPETFP
ncbi:MAG: hypothetical protein OEY80_11710, partial [Nitrospirota bacterium]|nr:hypothetical protein [Nitrospirota bacterium]